MNGIWATSPKWFRAISLYGTVSGILLLSAFGMSYVGKERPGLSVGDIRITQSLCGDPVSAFVRITNPSRERVRIVGCEPSCSCVTVTDVPHEIEPASDRDIAFQVQLPRAPTSVLLRLYIAGTDTLVEHTSTLSIPACAIVPASGSTPEGPVSSGPIPDPKFEEVIDDM